MGIRSRILKASYPAMKLYWRIRPATQGVRVIVSYENKVLLIRHSYGRDAWGIPGGGIKKYEDPLEGGVRETREETGIHLRKIESIKANPIVDKASGVLSWVYVAEAQSQDLHTDGVEIIEAQWFEKNDLPKEMLNEAKRAFIAAGYAI